MCGETMDPTNCRWYLAAETFLVGLPESTDGGPTMTAGTTSTYNYAYPTSPGTYTGSFSADGLSGCTGKTWLDVTLLKKTGNTVYYGAKGRHGPL